VFPAVVIDLGSQVAPNEAAWVLEACNAAIVSGTCELDTSASEPGRALAIVRWESEGRRSVRIEVGLRAEERADWSVREMEFSARDPARERWRSVGLVLATLVGEVEAARGQRPEQASAASAGTSAQRESAAGSAPPAAPAASETAAGAARTQSLERPQPAASAQPPAPARDDLASARTLPGRAPRFLAPNLPVIRPTTFVAAGVLAGSGADLDPLRWGGGVRGGWISPGGWVLSAAADYSRSALREGALEAEWLRLAAGAGYRLWWSKRWSFELGLELGVRGLSVVPNGTGSIHSTTWSAQGALHGEIWWQALSSAGAWLGVNASSIGRETHLLGLDGRAEAEVPWAESHGMVGIWWAP
jgi:hypothetical protein